MRCNKINCFAYNIKWSNNCEALHDIYGCNFFKTKQQLRDQIEELKEMGRPQYEPSSTRQGQRRLKALLEGAHERHDNMDKT